MGTVMMVTFFLDPPARACYNDFEECTISFLHINSYYLATNKHTLESLFEVHLKSFKGDQCRSYYFS